MKGELFLGIDLDQDVERSCDVCIVGSGAGGGVLAMELTARGLDVVMLEEGGYFTRDDFDGHEASAFPKLYQDRGARTSADLAITVLQGRSVGGGTTINWTTCYRTPDRILEHWQRVHGVDTFDATELRPHFEAIEERLGIAEWPEAMANPNNRVLLDGCRKLGWDAKALRRNVRGCVNSGYCGMGCPVGAKQAMHRTTLQDALDDGLTLYADCRADRFELDPAGKRVVAVHASILNRETGRPTGPKVVVKPKVFVSSCGAINGPALFLRSGVNPNGRVGKRTFIHPVVGVSSLHEQEIRPYSGAPQSIGSHEFIDRGPDKIGFFIETAPLHPMLGSLAFPGFGPKQAKFMQELPHVCALLALSVDGLLPAFQR